MKDKIQQDGIYTWTFHEQDIAKTATNMLLVCITIAKIMDMEWTLEIICAVPPAGNWWLELPVLDSGGDGITGCWWRGVGNKSDELEHCVKRWSHTLRKRWI
jgi:hypothetical protein